jgi:hypothetical protein
MAFKSWTARGVFGAGLGLALASAAALAPALAQDNPSRSLVITSPSAGTSIADPVTVSFSLADPGAAGSAPPMGQHHHGGQAYLVIDSAAPAAGDAISADPKHIAFPTGQHQLSVNLPAGQHQLQIVLANHENEVSSHIQPSAPITVTVQ